MLKTFDQLTDEQKRRVFFDSRVESPADYLYSTEGKDITVFHTVRKQVSGSAFTIKEKTL